MNRAIISSLRICYLICSLCLSVGFSDDFSLRRDDTPLGRSQSQCACWLHPQIRSPFLLDTQPPKQRPHFLIPLMLVLSHVWLFCDPMDCSPPGSSVHEISQAKILILEQIAIFYSKGSSWPRDQTHDSHISCTGREILYHQHHLGNA